jgi:hypothetical protein
MARLQVGSWYKYKQGEVSPKNFIFCILAVNRIRSMMPQVGWISVNTQNGKIDKDEWGKLSGAIDESKIEKLTSLQLKTQIAHKLLRVIFEHP